MTIDSELLSPDRQEAAAGERRISIGNGPAPWMALDPTQRWLRLLLMLVTLLLLAAVCAIVVRLGIFIEHTLLLFALGALVAYTLEPMVDSISRTRGIASLRASRPVSLTIVVLGLLAVCVVLAWSLEGRVVDQIAIVHRNYPRYEARALTEASKVDDYLSAHGIPFSLTHAIEHPPADVEIMAKGAARQILPFVSQTFVDIGEFLVVLLIAFYFLLFAPEMRARFNRQLPEPFRQRANLWETDVSLILGGFVRGQLIIALVMGIAGAIGCLAIGIGTWLVIGVFVAVTSLIPVFGPYLGAIPAIIAALVGPTYVHNPGVAAVLILIYFVIINEAGSKILYPRLVGAALGLHTMVVLFVLFAGLEVSGIVGVLLAAPLTALCVVTAIHLYRFWQGLPDCLLCKPLSAPGPPGERVTQGANV